LKIRKLPQKMAWHIICNYLKTYNENTNYEKELDSDRC